MKIVIVGDGKVGYTLTKRLSQEGHDIVVIDNNRSVLLQSQEALDVAVVDGNGASVEVQREAGVGSSDLLIAATSGDETNLLCCMVARKLGCRHTIARVRNPEYDQQTRFLKDELGLSMVINPEKAAALEIFRLLQYPSFLKRDSFAKGSVELVELKIKENNVLANTRLDQFRTLSNVNALVCAVERGGMVSIPKGSFSLQVGDKLTIATDAGDLVRLIKNLGVYTPKAQHVMIIGGSRTAKYLAQRLISSKVKLTIIEKNEKRCQELSETLPEATIVHGNGTEQGLLIEEGIRKMDAVVTLTGMDEENLIVSMFADYIGVPKSVTKINRTEYNNVYENKGIDSIVSPKLLTTNEIIRYVRAMDDTTGGSVVTLYRIVDGKAEALEFSIKNDAPYNNISLHKLRLKPNILIASIIRARKVIIPSGNDEIRRGDTVIIVTTTDHAIAELRDIFIRDDA
ncbi:MAG: Trk system potassium transporter TrkA [Christensenella sp.]|jgi:trk system potassium uptake protein TrkA|nr:Trk system potassium transporter TrkA [Christensenella sp.]